MSSVKNILMLSCKKATELVGKKLVGKLSSVEQLQLKMHMSMCKACSNYLNQQTLIDAKLKDDCNAPTSEEDCEELKLRILDQLRDQKE